MPPAVFPVSSCVLSPSLGLLPFWVEADWSPSLAVALPLCILAGAVAKGCPKLGGPSLPQIDPPLGGRSWDALAVRNKRLPQGTGCRGCWGALMLRRCLLQPGG